MPADTVLSPVQSLHLLLELPVGLHFVNHLVNTVVKLGLALLDAVYVLTHTVQLIFHPIDSLLNVIEHRNHLKSVETKQVGVCVEPYDAFHALIPDEFDAAAATPRRHLLLLFTFFAKQA